MKPKHYVIGDVHGEFDMLLSLVAQLPRDARLIFVGDLVNRGSKSRQVIEFVRERAFGVVQGNHETYLLEHSQYFFEELERQKATQERVLWRYISATEVLLSYGLLMQENENDYYLVDNADAIEPFKDDLNYLASLPCYLELGAFKGYDLPIVITHGSVGEYWHLKELNFEAFKTIAQTNREVPCLHAPIFNIYGHVRVPEVTVGKNYASIDTGCGAKLSAFCIETQEVFEVKKGE